MTTRLWWVVVLLVVSACPTAVPCSGCVDAKGVCQLGTAHQACGANGAACSSCFLMHSACVQQVCVLAPDGGGAGGGGGSTVDSGVGGGGGGGGGVNASCPLGCVDSTGACQTGASHLACGTGGVTCTDCTLHHSGCVGQVCILQPDGGGAGSGGAPLTYPDAGTTTRYWDGGTCTGQSCPCFSSDDCGLTQYCHSLDTSGANVFCTAGYRGAGLVGAPCSGESDCFSALCVEASDGGKSCSALCDSATECVPALPKCLYVGFGIDRSLCSP